MKKTFFFSIVCLCCCIFMSCQPEKPKDNRLLSFDPKDSALVDELVRFYIDSNIIPKEALICQHPTDKYLSYSCINENCEIANDFMQDSLSGTFFAEVAYATGSSGNNNIYICNKSENGFRILYSIEGQIDSYLGPDTMINNYKVLYIRQQDEFLQLYYDGKQFTTKPFQPAEEKTDLDILAQN